MAPALQRVAKEPGGGWARDVAQPPARRQREAVDYDLCVGAVGLGLRRQLELEAVGWRRALQRCTRRGRRARLARAQGALRRCRSPPGGRPRHSLPRSAAGWLRRAPPGPACCRRGLFRRGELDPGLYAAQHLSYNNCSNQ